MLVEKELARKALTKASNNWKNSYQNMDKKTSGSILKEMHTLNRHTEYTCVGTLYTQALEQLLAKGKMDLLRSN